MERELHSRFAADRLYGEWFKRSADLLALIASLDGLTEIEPPLAPVKDTIDFDDMVRTWKAHVG